MMTRRAALKTAALTAAFSAASPLLRGQNTPPTPTAPPPAPTGPFKLPALPYAADALEPHIDAKTMEIHHGKHHAAYVANLNKAIAADAALAGTGPNALEDLLKNPRAMSIPAVRNNGGGHFNHMLFWQMMTPKGGGAPKGKLAEAINKKFGNLNAFQDAFSKAALGQFGSGWAWLTLDSNHQLAIESTPNQDSPLSGANGRIPLLGVDVWEHAYYLKYQNRRADYVTAFFKVINWDFVADRFQKHSA